HIKMMLQVMVFDGMYRIQVFHEDLQRPEIIFYALPEPADAFRPRRSCRRSMGARKYSVPGQAIVLSIQFFGVHQLRDLLKATPIIVLNAVIAGGAGRKGVMISAAVFL